MMGNPQGQLTWALGSSWTQNQQLGFEDSMHEVRTGINTSRVWGDFFLEPTSNSYEEISAQVLSLSLSKCSNSNLNHAISSKLAQLLLHFINV